LLILFILFNG